MDLVHERAAGIDISKGDAKVAIRSPGKRAGTFSTEVTTWGSTTNQILALRDMLVAAKVTTVVMEATSDYWKPFYYLMEDLLPVIRESCLPTAVPLCFVLPPRITTAPSPVRPVPDPHLPALRH